METHKVFFKVSLSNGENVYENKGDYIRLDGELSPWERLKTYLAENNLSITSLGLYTADGRTFNLISSGENPKFRIFDQSQKPQSYNFFRRAGADYGKEWEIYTVAEAVYSDHKLQVWVDGLSFNSWTLIEG